MDWLPFDENVSDATHVVVEEAKEADYYEANGDSIAISNFTDALIEALCK